MRDPRSWLTASLVASLVAGALWAAAADPVVGEWVVAGGSAKVRIGPCEAAPATLCGVLTWLRNGVDKSGAALLDAANPDPALRRRPLVGVAMISGFRRAEPGRWVDGRIYDPDSGKTYKSKMSMTADGKLSVSGCVLVFCQAQIWTRAAN
jgi:uncharacterized protein (DUF2147 family)